MMARAQFGLSVLAGVLALLLLAECLLPEDAAQAWQRALPSASNRTDLASDAEVADWAGSILARPLLSETRRPAPVAGVAVDDSLPRLSAIIVIAGVRRAIFVASGEKPQAVAEGGEIGVYRVKTVAPDSVGLLGPDGLVTVKLQFTVAHPALTS
jgi:hypothetical protein